MSDTVLALILTGLILLALAAWVPLLHAAETMTRKYARRVAERRSAKEQDLSPGFNREAA